MARTITRPQAVYEGKRNLIRTISKGNRMDHLPAKSVANARFSLQFKQQFTFFKDFS